MIEVFQYTCHDFKLSVDSYHAKGHYHKAVHKIGNIQTATSYSISHYNNNFSIWSPDKNSLVDVKNGQPFFPVFFENADYIFDISFSRNIKKPKIYSRLREIAEKFNFKNRNEFNTLTGTLNFGNNIGKYDFIIKYEYENIQKEFIFSFDVFPIKMDYKKDYRKIINDIEIEYTNLSLDFLKKTYTNFKPSKHAGNSLIWWSIFNHLFTEMLFYSKIILNKPKYRLSEKSVLLKKAEIIKTNPYLEEQIFLNNHNPKKLFYSTKNELTVDTPENRFIKFALTQSYLKFRIIKDNILTTRINTISEDFIIELNSLDRKLKNVLSHPFFKVIGQFSGLKQDLLVLQKSYGYTSIYRSWLLLKKGFVLFESIIQMNLKDIAELYQIWCFLKMKNIISSILEVDPIEVNLAKIKVDKLVYSFKKGTSSKVVFRKENQIIELFHDYTFGVKTDFENLSYTVEQRPDIVLKIRKNDLIEDYNFTYLYDAKYRLTSDENENEPDGPTNDSINQMHRYRDAIYFQNIEKKGKEIIGGYILFPGSGGIEQIKNQQYYKSIKEVNIGAFPLLPGDQDDSQTLFKLHLEQLLSSKSDTIFQEIIPQKGLQYSDPNALVLAGFISNPLQIEYFKSSNASIYHMPVSQTSGKIHTIRKLEKIRFFAPIFDGIEEFFQVDEIVLLTRNEIFPIGHPLNNMDMDTYYVFRLSNKKKLKQKILTGMIGGNRVFRYAKLSELLSAKSISEFNKEMDI